MFLSIVMKLFFLERASERPLIINVFAHKIHNS